jgi:type I site-specific restriction-modification system R (restriction) subunit
LSRSRARSSTARFAVIVDEAHSSQSGEMTTSSLEEA